MFFDLLKFLTSGLGNFLSFVKVFAFEVKFYEIEAILPLLSPLLADTFVKEEKFVIFALEYDLLQVSSF